MSMALRGGENIRKNERILKAQRSCFSIIIFFWCSQKEWGSLVQVL